MSESSNSHSENAHELLSKAMKLPLELGEKWFKEALQEARQIPNAVEQGSFLLEVARILPESLFNELVKIVEKLPDAMYRALIFQQIVKRSPQSKQKVVYIRAFAAITEIKDNDKREMLFQKFTAQEPHLSDKQMLEIARKQPDINVRTLVLVALSKKMAETDRQKIYSDILKDIRKLADEEKRIQLLIYIIEYVKPSDLVVALGIARTTKDLRLKAKALFQIILRLRDQSGESSSQYISLYKEFLSVIQGINGELRLSLLIWEASGYVPTILVKEMLQVLLRIQEERQRFTSLVRLVGQISEEHLPEFLLHVQTFSSSDFRVRALAEILQKMHGQKRNEIFQTILQEVERMPKTESSVDLLASIAKEASEDESLQLSKIALARARSISDKDLRIYALANLPRDLLNDGEIKDIERHENTLRNRNTRIVGEAASQKLIFGDIDTGASWRLSGDTSTDAPPPPKK